MKKWAYRFSFQHPRIAAIVFGCFSIIQFSVETLFLICFAVYAATPISTVTKAFYAFAAIAAPFLLVLSVLYVYTISKNEHRWMIPWLASYSIVTIAELVFTAIAFILINDMHEIFQFYANAWALAQFQASNQLLIGNTTDCVPVPSTLLSNSADGVYFAALFSQQGAQGVIAFFVLSLLLKNVFNIAMLIAGFGAYRDIRDGGGGSSSSTPSRTHSYYDPHIRATASRRNRPITSINAVAR